jgi:hypothetical protein
MAFVFCHHLWHVSRPHKVLIIFRIPALLLFFLCMGFVETDGSALLIFGILPSTVQSLSLNCALPRLRQRWIIPTLQVQISVIFSGSFL